MDVRRAAARRPHICLDENGIAAIGSRASYGKVWCQIDMTAQRIKEPAVDQAFKLNGFPLAEFDRKPIDMSLLKGFVLAWSDDLTMIHTIEEHTFKLNGYAIFRNSDIHRWRVITEDSFLAKASRLNKVAPSLPDVAITCMRDALTSAANRFPMITIHREQLYPGVCEVGRLLRTSQRSVALLAVGPKGTWEREESFLLRDITLLEFGGAYEKLLTRMAGPPTLVAG